ncbi:asparagine synthase (glutamine-hydrolyzing) [Croceitalea sp. MTPC9]|uniref:asparagine synthase (glutamine-hydrolyzing) n=1 Tax=unclassified Croceitalea TaxID=2632280 RepID=UPI002B3B757A|nr:asparagine synthase (glutamine-hydrolyzing) [Croceitalea sp. MTPC6]GMN15993.1 asparagine synthase (glutamine-hydrolyzing) [Croceitalea sp. MTPC9]
MCGIFGIINLDKEKFVCQEKIIKSIERVKHRGPDNRQTELVTPYVGFAHARLSILDLTESANQPFNYLTLTIIFNGEIFNYIELKEELQIAGYKFKTDSDTEVITAAYHLWGEDCVNKFNGMWAFAIYDKENDTVFCSRDRFGIKPFYYTIFEGNLLFASEIKSILEYCPELKKPNYNAISAFCRETVGAQNVESWFEGINRLPSAHNLIIKKEVYNIYKYWDYPDKVDKSLSWPEALETYRKIFNDAIKIRLRSDVPLGATLSGGLDSASIVCTVDKIFRQEINTYTASFPEEKYDEYKTVDSLRKDYNFLPNQVIVDYNDFLPRLNQLIYHLESGHASPAIFPLSKINKKAKEKLTVILEGQGADELLGGYLDSIFVDHLIDLISSLKLKKATRDLREFKSAWSLKTAILLFGRLHLPRWAKSLYRKLDGTEFVYSVNLKRYNKTTAKVPKLKFNKKETRVNKMLKTQHKNGLENLLHYGDAISMMYSLESRLPFMDYKLVEFAFKLPAQYKIQQGFGKYIHRKAMEDVLPDDITYDRSKIGFKSPIEKVMTENKSIQDILLSDRLNNRKLFNRDTIKKLLKLTISKKKDYSRLLFRILEVEIWFRTFIDQENSIISESP